MCLASPKLGLRRSARVRLCLWSTKRGSVYGDRPPSYSGLVRRPLTAVTRVQIPLGVQHGKPLSLRTGWLSWFRELFCRPARPMYGQCMAGSPMCDRQSYIGDRVIHRRPFTRTHTPSFRPCSIGECRPKGSSAVARGRHSSRLGGTRGMNGGEKGRTRGCQPYLGLSLPNS